MDEPEEFKSLEKLFVGDWRSRMRGFSPAAIHGELSHIELREFVPIPVQSAFNTAKNLVLYGAFAYPFLSLALQHALQSFELALRIKLADLEADTDRNDKPLRFSALIDRAKSMGLLTERNTGDRRAIAIERCIIKSSVQLGVHLTEEHPEIPIPEPTEAEIQREMAGMSILDDVCRATPQLRNTLAHGTHPLGVNPISHLRMTASLINQLYPIDEQ